MSPVSKFMYLLLPALWSFGILATLITGVSSSLSRRAIDHGRIGLDFLSHKGIPPYRMVQGGVKLRILSVGDSITVGYGQGTDGHSYRLRLRENLANNQVVWAGTEMNPKGDMQDGYFAAWSGKTIQYIDNKINSSLQQQPNLILVDAGRNDMNSNLSIATEGNSPEAAILRLKSMVEKMIAMCPDATIILAMPSNVCDSKQYFRQRERIKVYSSLIAELAEEFRGQMHHVLAADFGPFRQDMLSDCVHPQDVGYLVMGDWWYDFIYQIPKGWIQEPLGSDPNRTGSSHYS
ncbi:acetylxylan esterase [Fusarium heterosporum]|uniref:Acetylxylan esterase n=1 Tax=Fusarium heterosporum TaxID=42747 RepID=A0A8H5WMA6_FUSHE|nr:acetylxylan esterase [Fusarium heterosporum]